MEGWVSTAESDRSSIRPADVAGRTFSEARRGYNREEVDAFLRSLAKEMSRLQGEIEWHRARSEHREGRAAPAREAAYERITRNFMDVVRSADEAAARIRSEAEVEGRATVASAHEEAARLVGEAAVRSEGVASAARTEANAGVASARAEAGRVISAGKAEAARIVAAAQADAARIMAATRTGSEEANRKATEDAERRKRMAAGGHPSVWGRETGRPAHGEHDVVVIPDPAPTEPEPEEDRGEDVEMDIPHFDLWPEGESDPP
jgi:DivIVA domain-containing protein